MWFKFPDGVDQVSVERQVFMPEHKDKDGGQYFRAPDHFAPTILGLGGFQRVEQPEGAPEDLPKEDPKAAEAIDQMALQMDALVQEVGNLRQFNKELVQQNEVLKKANDALEKELEEKDEEVQRLQSVEKSSAGGAAKKEK